MSLFHVIPNLNSGGAENFLLSLTNNLLENYKQYIFTFDNPKKDDLYSKFNKKLIFISKKNNLIEALNVNKNATIICWMYSSIIFIEKLIIFNKIEAKIVWNIRHSGFSRFQIKQKLGLLFLGIVSRYRNPFIVYCAYTSQRYHQKYGFSKRRDKVIHNGLTKELNFIDNKKQKRPYLLYVGRFDYAKGPDILMDVFKEFSETNISFALKIVGHGWNLKKIPKSLKNRIEILGNQEDLTLFYAHTEGFLFTSRTEGYPNVLAEACSFGLQIIAMDAGDAKVILKNYPFGHIVKTKKEFIKELLKLKKPSIKLRKKAALEFRKENIFNKTKEAYVNLIDNL